MTTILLTSTIAPNAAMPNHKSFDIPTRLSEYKSALTWYLGQAPRSVTRLLFCDNSGHDLSELIEHAEAIRPGHVEVDFYGYTSTVPPTRGKGACEMELVDMAMRVFADRLDERIWKISGRLQVQNIAEMIETQPEAYDIYADFRDVPFIRHSLGGNQWIDMRAFAFSPHGHAKYLAGEWEHTHSVIEWYLFSKIAPHLDHDRNIFPRLLRQPEFVGVCGGSGKDYRSTSYLAKNMLRRMTRRLAPGLWL